MILVGQFDSPFTRRVAISMHLLGIPFTRNTMSGFGEAAAMRKINPLGRIPSLILDDGEVLIDSAAILDHLDEVVGKERALLPPSGAARRRALQTIALASGCIDKAGAIVYERSVRPPEKLHQPWIDWCRVQLDSGLAALNAPTGAGWYGGARPMQPDVTVACMLGYLHLRLPEPLDAIPRLEAFYARFAALDVFRATMPAPDELMPGRPL
jgi:glutathione S-transferase